MHLRISPQDVNVYLYNIRKQAAPNNEVCLYSNTKHARLYIGSGVYIVNVANCPPMFIRVLISDMRLITREYRI